LDLVNKVSFINIKVDSLLLDYQNTYLTVSEKEVFREYLENIDLLRTKEENPAAKISQLNSLYDKNIQLLNRLSSIQMKVGEDLYNNSRSIVTNNASLSYLELGLLIILGLIAQALIFNSKSMNRSIRKDHNNLPLN